MVVKMKINFCSVDYVDKQGQPHCTAFVVDGNKTYKFSTDKFIPADTLCEFSLDTLVDMRKSENDRWRPGQFHGVTYLKLVRAVSN